MWKKGQRELKERKELLVETAENFFLVGKRCLVLYYLPFLIAMSVSFL